VWEFILITRFPGNGEQGFKNAPVPDSFILDGVGAMGITHTERGLTLYDVVVTGHM
jgi:carboxypeptidase D